MLIIKLGSFAEEDIGGQGMGGPSVAGNATASRGLEVAVSNLQEYCNGTSMFNYSATSSNFSDVPKDHILAFSPDTN